jgi:hypothetical protein
MPYFNFNSCRLSKSDSLKDKTFEKRLLGYMITCLLINALCSHPSFGQAVGDSDWTFIKEEGKVKYHYKLSTCTGLNSLILKFESEKEVATILSFKVQISDADGDFQEAVNEEGIVLLPSQILVGSCDGAQSDSASKLVFVLDKTYSNPVVSLDVVKIH